jgi:hypothetical protein
VVHEVRVDELVGALEIAPRVDLGERPTDQLLVVLASSIAIPERCR